jgi:hypothetical protein
LQNIYCTRDSRTYARTQVRSATYLRTRTRSFKIFRTQDLVEKCPALQSGLPPTLARIVMVLKMSFNVELSG